MKSTLGTALAIWVAASFPARADLFDYFVDLVSSDTPAGAWQCRQEPVISVQTPLLEPVFTQSKPSNIESFSQTNGVLQGSADMPYGYDIFYTFERIQSSSSNCVRVKELIVRTSLKNPSIWLRPGLVKDSCEYRVTIEHEMDHIENFHNHIRRFGLHMRRDLPKFMSANNYRTVSSPENYPAAESYLEQNIKGFIDQYHDASYRISKTIDRSMDTPEEYRRLSRICS